MSLKQARQRVLDLCQPVADPDPAGIDRALVRAASELTERLPEVIVGGISTVDGIATLANLGSWVSGVSRVMRVWDATTRDPLAAHLWRQYTEADGTEELVLDATVSGESNLMVKYSGALTYDTTAGTTNLTGRKLEAAALLAAAEILESWVARWAQSKALNVASESFEADHTSEASSLAGKYRKTAETIMRRPVIGFSATPGV